MNSNIPLNGEIQKLLDSIVEDSAFSSRELQERYMQKVEFREFVAKLQMKWNSLAEKIKILRKEHLDKSDKEFFELVVISHAQKYISAIKQEYEGSLSKEALERLDKFNLEIIFDENFDHDMTAYSEESKISINMAKFAPGKSLETKIIQAMGTIPHEITHLFIKMLKEPGNAREEMHYMLKNGEQAFNNGMVGHILNEGFVEEFTSEFCEQHDIFYTISPSYISLVQFCTAIKKHSSLTYQKLFHMDYEGVLDLLSPELIESYKEAERKEYAENFALRFEDGTKRKVTSDEIFSSKNVAIQKKEDVDLTNKSKEELENLKKEIEMLNQAEQAKTSEESHTENFHL